MKTIFLIGVSLIASLAVALAAAFYVILAYGLIKDAIEEWKRRKRKGDK